MSTNRVGESFPIPQDPKERTRYLIRSGEITTRELNEMHTFNPEKEAYFAADSEAQTRELQAARDSITRLE